MSSPPPSSSRDDSIRQKYPLHVAVWENNIELLRELLEADSSHINAVDPHGRTPCHLATILGHIDCGELLLGILFCFFKELFSLDKDADANTQDKGKRFCNRFF